MVVKKNQKVTMCFSEVLECLMCRREESFGIVKNHLKNNSPYDDYVDARVRDDLVNIFLLDLFLDVYGTDELFTNSISGKYCWFEEIDQEECVQDE